MKDLPVVAKAVINIVLYILYVVLAWVVFSFIFPLVMQVFGQEIINPAANMALFDKIAIFIAILVLLISLILRKYFYICGQNEETVVYRESYTAKKKPVNKKKTTKTVKIEEEDDDEEIKIYVEKEIK
ncbi:hypothetical protein LR010_01935 [Candidatus Gracilibacteria bacterium]|nr:hypothetical protein [Candidatus Gracilibacteria bacterium]